MTATLTAASDPSNETLLKTDTNKQTNNTTARQNHFKTTVQFKCFALSVSTKYYLNSNTRHLPMNPDSLLLFCYIM